ncbi:MAG TPA: biotin--[acetyl-CoA-carboxylase] ligase [Acidimicrobiia bacterium]|jgi:BirA family biotin operon repressor/biotin-[acetyl-CoA-carboxylase] ligase
MGPDAEPSDAEPRQTNGGTRFAVAEWFAEIDSTNRYLADAARASALDGRVAVADVQHAGRGRLDREWTASPGSSLLVSVLVRPNLPREMFTWLTGAAGLAAVETVTSCCDLPARTKWPNDVVLDRGPMPGKLAGVLAEAVGDAVVIGMGLNVAWDVVPDELTGIATAVSLAGGRVVDREVLLAEWLQRFDRHLGWLERDPAGGSAHIARLLRGRSATLGRHVRAELPSGSIEGIAADIDAQGALVMERPDGTRVTVGAGDVIHLR